MSNVRFDELELMLMAMFEQPTLKDTIQVLMEVQPLVAEDAEMPSCRLMMAVILLHKCVCRFQIDRC